MCPNRTQLHSAHRNIGAPSSIPLHSTMEWNNNALTGDIPDSISRMASLEYEGERGGGDGRWGREAGVVPTSHFECTASLRCCHCTPPPCAQEPHVVCKPPHGHPAHPNVDHDLAHVSRRCVAEPSLLCYVVIAFLCETHTYCCLEPTIGRARSWFERLCTVCACPWVMCSVLGQRSGALTGEAWFVVDWPVGVARAVGPAPNT